MIGHVGARVTPILESHSEPTLQAMFKVSCDITAHLLRHSYLPGFLFSASALSPCSLLFPSRPGWRLIHSLFFSMVSLLEEHLQKLQVLDFKAMAENIEQVGHDAAADE